MLRNSSFTLAMTLVASSALATSSRADVVWNLQPTSGNQGSGWAVEPNWTWGDGNPLTVEGGAIWTVMTQTTNAPSRTDTYTALTQGLSPTANYFRVWNDDNFTQTEYRNYQIRTGKDVNSAGTGRSVAMLFTAPSDGLYRFQIGGSANIQSPTVGYGIVDLYTLSSDMTVASDAIDEQRVNQNEAFTSVALYTFDDTVELDAGEHFVLRLRAFQASPTSNVGATAFNMDPSGEGRQFTVTLVPEPGALGLLGLGSILIVSRRKNTK